jgi:hypothetical protein
LNRYIYAHDRPINFADPSGMNPTSQVLNSCNLSPGEKAGRVGGGVILIGGGLINTAIGAVVGALGVSEVAGAGAETIATDGLAAPVAIIQFGGGVDLVGYGVAQGALGVGAAAGGVALIINAATC